MTANVEQENGNEIERNRTNRAVKKWLRVKFNV